MLWRVATVARDSDRKKILCLQDFNQQALSNTLWSYAILRHHPGDAFLDAAAEQILHRIGDFNAQVYITLIASAQIALLSCLYCGLWPILNRWFFLLPMEPTFYHSPLSAHLLCRLWAHHNWVVSLMNMYHINCECCNTALTYSYVRYEWSSFKDLK